MATFRLATVERLRANRVQECARALGAATSAVEESLGRRQSLTQQLLSSTAGQQVDSAQDLMTASWFRERIRTELIALEVEIESRTALLEVTRGEWILARAQLKAVESLHETHRAGVRADQVLTEQREVDDLAGAGAARRLVGTRGEGE